MGAAYTEYFFDASGEPPGIGVGGGGGGGSGGGGGGGSVGGGSSGGTGTGGVSTGGGSGTGGPILSGDFGPVYPLSLGQLLGLPGLPGLGGCDFGVCGGPAPEGFLPVLAGAGGACVVLEPCGISVGTGALIAAGAVFAAAAVYKGIQIYQASRQEAEFLNYVARKYCVDRNQFCVRPFIGLRRDVRVI